MPTIDEIKKKAAVYAADFIKQGMTIGLGTGSTVYWLIEELGTRIKQGLSVSIVPTSKQTQTLAEKFGIPVININDIGELALTIDGADEINHQLQLIKGGGGALLQEKIVASISKELIIIADSSKLVQQLGKFPLPVEVIPFGYKHVQQKILDLNCSKVLLRIRNGSAFISDHGHYILDCYFDGIDDAKLLDSNLHNIPGVVETGLFLNMATSAILASANGSMELLNKS